MTGKIETKSPGKRQARSIRTEQKLLDAAETLFATQGYQATRINDIVAKAGVSTGSFYHHFTDKEALGHALVSRFIEDGNKIIETLDLSQRVHGDIKGLLTFLAEQLCETITRRLGVYRASQRLNTLGSHETPDPGILVAALQTKVLAQLPAYSDQISADNKRQALNHALQILIMIILQTRLGRGQLFPQDDAGVIKVAVKAATGLLKKDDAT